ncbi:MAG: hypothetical protein ACR65X_05110 [Methylocystis sp.]|jgi:hypothetical protein
MNAKGDPSKKYLADATRSRLHRKNGLNICGFQIETSIYSGFSYFTQRAAFFFIDLNQLLNSIHKDASWCRIVILASNTNVIVTAPTSACNGQASRLAARDGMSAIVGRS